MFHVKPFPPPDRRGGARSPGARFSRQSRRSRGNRSQLGRDAIEVRVHPRDSLVRDLPGQLGGGALACRIERSLGQRQVSPPRERHALAAGQQHVVDAELLEATLASQPPFARNLVRLPHAPHARCQHARNLHAVTRQLGGKALKPARLARSARRPSTRTASQRQPLPGCLFLNVYYTLPHIEEWRRDGTRRLEERRLP